MKTIRKVLCLSMALLLMVMLTLPALAAGNYTITIDNSAEGFTYEAYQVFAGDLTKDAGKTVLSNITWGDGVDDTALLAALQGDGTIGASFADCTTAADVAEALADFRDDSTNLDAFAEIVASNLSGAAAGTSIFAGSQYTISNLDAGYYFVKSTVVPATATHTKYILKVTDDVTIHSKHTDIPTVEKKVLENVKYDQNGGYGTGYNDVADYNIGDTVSFKLIGTVPDMSAYDTYKYVFHDTMSSGLTLNKGSIKVYLTNAKDAALTSPLATGYTTPVTTDGCSFEVSFADLKSVAGIGDAQYVVVTFDTTLNSDAVIGLDGNPNEVLLEFSNNPYTEGTGKTPKDAAIVFTYQLDTTKVDGADQTPLQDAEFVLFNAEKTAVAQIDVAGKLDAWVDLTTIEAEATANTITYEQLSAYDGGTIILSSAPETGKFGVIGLDDGTYYLREIKAPGSYNLLTEDVAVSVTATTANGQSWDDFVAANAFTALNVTAGGTGGTGAVDTGTVSITVENSKGSTLPETGGIGTTLFYGLGAVLVMGAGVLLVVRARMRP